MYLFDIAAMEDILKLSNKLIQLIAFVKSDNRAFASVLREGINFALTDAPTNVPFLDALEAFLTRASEVEVRQVYVYVTMNLLCTSKQLTYVVILLSHQLCSFYH